MSLHISGALLSARSCDASIGLAQEPCSADPSLFLAY